MAENRIEPVPQSAIEQLLGYGAKLSENTTKTLGNQLKPLGTVSEFLTGGLTELAKDMSWGQSLFTPGGHGPNIDPRITELPGFGTAAKMSKAAAVPLAAYIGGKRSALANLPALAEAQEMKAAGKTADEIWDKTKWWGDHPDKQWRFEFSHNDEEFINNNMLRQEMYEYERQTDLDGVFDPAEFDRYTDIEDWATKEKIAPFRERMRSSPILQQYPALARKLGIRSTLRPGNTRGSYKSGANEIHINDKYTSAEMESTAQHEIQHAISEMEKFAPGGNPADALEFVKSDTKKKIQELAEKLLDKQKVQKPEDLQRLIKLDELSKQAKNADETQAWNYYRQLADEVQARLVQSRSHMTQAQMDADAFWKKYEVPPNQQIIMDR